MSPALLVRTARAAPVFLPSNKRSEAVHARVNNDQRGFARER